MLAKLSVRYRDLDWSLVDFDLPKQDIVLLVLQSAASMTMVALLTLLVRS